MQLSAEDKARYTFSTTLQLTCTKCKRIYFHTVTGCNLHFYTKRVKDNWICLLCATPEFRNMSNYREEEDTMRMDGKARMDDKNQLSEGALVSEEQIKWLQSNLPVPPSWTKSLLLRYANGVKTFETLRSAFHEIVDMQTRVKDASALEARKAQIKTAGDAIFKRAQLIHTDEG